MSLPNLGTSVGSSIPLNLPGHNIPVKEMYNIAMRNNTTWGIDGYQVPVQHVDSRKLAEISSGKQKKPAPRALKSIDYLADTMRATRDIPGPNKYDIVKPWVDEKNQPKQAKHITKKNTYIDDIIQEAKIRPTPGPGAHNPWGEEKKDDKKREAKGSDRSNFLMEVEFVSNLVPGPGMYNPREIQPKIKETKMKPEDWKKKHGEQKKNEKKSGAESEKTAMPFPVAFNTFGKLYETSKDKSKAAKGKTWGTSARFVIKKDNKKELSGVPGPGMYDMRATWNGKQAPNLKDKKDKNWMNKITKGVEKSIYYS